MLNRSPEEACAPFIEAMDRSSNDESRQNSPRSVVSTGETFASIPPFHDASNCECTYDLTILDCLRGLAKARMYNFFNFDNFDIKEYEWFEQVEVSFIESCFSRHYLNNNILIFCFLYELEWRLELDYKG